MAGFNLLEMKPKDYEPMPPSRGRIAELFQPQTLGTSNEEVLERMEKMEKKIDKLLFALGENVLINGRWFDPGQLKK